MSDDSLSRRAFLCRALLVAGIGGTASGAFSMHRPGGKLNGTVTVRLSDHPALGAINGSVRIEIPGLWFRIIVTRVSVDTFITVSEVCPHHGCDVDNLDTGTMRFTCPCHFSQYGVDGTVLKGPSIRSLERFSTTWDGEDILLIEIEDLSSVLADNDARSFLNPPAFSLSGSLCTLRYGLDRPSHLLLGIHSSTGEEVMRVVDDRVEGGSYSLSVDLSSLAAGFYLCRMQTSGGFAATATFVVEHR